MKKNKILIYIVLVIVGMVIGYLTSGGPTTGRATQHYISIKGIECNDKVDNDFDGLVDLKDPGCTDIWDRSEYTVPIYACSNGWDDDRDKLIDYPADPGCSSPTDKSER